MQNETQEDYLNSSKAVIILSNSTDRKTIKIFLKDLGVPLSNIISLDPTDDWQDVVNKEQPNIICFSNDDQKRSYKSYIKYHDLVFAEQYRSLKILLNDKASDVTEEKVLYGFDVVICRPYTSKSVKDELAKSIPSKINIPEDQKFFSRCQSLLRSNNYSKLEVEINNNQEFKDSASFLFYQAKVLEHRVKIDDAILKMEEAFKIEPENTQCAALYVELLVENSQFNKAQPYIKLLLEKNQVKKTTIVPIIKCCLANKTFDTIFKLFDVVNHIDLTPQHKIPLSAGMTMACKYFILRNKNLESVKDYLYKVIPFSCNKENIKASIFNMLIDINEHKYVKEEIEKIATEDLCIEYQIIELRVSAITEDSPYKTLEKGSNLLNQEVKVFDIYEIMIQKSLEAKRDNKIIEDLADEANRLFPENKSTIDKLYKVS